MRIERAGDLMFVTYFMVNWEKEATVPSGRKCAECRREMGGLEAVVGSGEVEYEGLVCHSCKRLLWMKKD